VLVVIDARVNAFHLRRCSLPTGAVPVKVGTHPAPCHTKLLTGHDPRSIRLQRIIDAAVRHTRLRLIRREDSILGRIRLPQEDPSYGTSRRRCDGRVNGAGRLSERAARRVVDPEPPGAVADELSEPD
jgi:hypothetical protein